MYSTFSIVVVAVVLGLSASVDAQRIDDKGRALTGIGPIGIVIENIKPNAQHHGLTKKLLRFATELSLRRNGIPTTESPVVLSTLHLRVDTLKVPDVEAFVFTFLVTLEQPIYNLATKQNMLAYTWQEGYHGYVPSEDLSDTVRNVVLQRIDEFSLDYLMANPTSKKNPLDAVKP